MNLTRLNFLFKLIYLKLAHAHVTIQELLFRRQKKEAEYTLNLKFSYRLQLGIVTWVHALNIVGDSMLVFDIYLEAFGVILNLF